jgi:hypothetical protein
METTSTSPRRALAATAVGAVALASALAFAGPVQADATGHQDGCTITVKDPTYRETSTTGDDRYTYKFVANCLGKRTVEYKHEVYQARGSGLQLRETRTGQWSFTQGVNTRATKQRTPWNTLKNYNTSGRELVHHRLKFKVTSDSGVAGQWSQWVATEPLSVNG